MDKESMDIWQHLYRTGLDIYELKVLRLLYESGKPLLKSEIIEQLKCGDINLKSLLERNWVLRKNAIEKDKKVYFQYGINDLNIIIDDIDRELEEDYAYQKNLIRLSREWVQEHHKENNRNKPENKRVGRPVSRSKRYK